MENVKNRNRKYRKMSGGVLLGTGAFSKVYRVMDEETKEFVVCKISSWTELAKKEADILEKINHPLFPAYRGKFYENGQFCLIMEYICGEQLQKIVKRRGGISQQRAVEIVLELAKGLLYLHELPEPVIFRDIKPENVLIQQDGRVRLVDLGCAYICGVPPENRAGSRGYAAPEQFIQGEEIGMESDVYALGKLLEFMLAGTRKVSPGLKRLMKRAVQEEPKQRIPDMRTFRKLLLPYREKDALKRVRLKVQNRNLGKNSFFYKTNVRKIN